MINVRRVQNLAGMGVVAAAVVALFLGGAAGASAAPAKVMVVPQVGIAGANLGMTERAVRRRIGPPAVVRRVPWNNWDYRNWHYPRMRLVVGLLATPGQKTLKVVDVNTTSPHAKTKRGVGVGSTLQQLWRAYPAADCDTFRGRSWCTTGESDGLHTRFDFRRGRVKSISIGYPI